MKPEQRIATALASVYRKAWCTQFREGTKFISNSSDYKTIQGLAKGILHNRAIRSASEENGDLVLLVGITGSNTERMKNGSPQLASLPLQYPPLSSGDLSALIDEINKQINKQNKQ